MKSFNKYFTNSCYMSGTLLISLEYQTKRLQFLPQKVYLLQGTKDSKYN